MKLLAKCLSYTRISHFILKLVMIKKFSVNLACADPESFVREGQTLTMFFFTVDERIQILRKAGHHRPASETPMMAQH